MKKALRNSGPVESTLPGERTAPHIKRNDATATPLDRERRKQARHSLAIKVYLRVPGTEIMGTSADLSAGGIRIVSPVHLRSGAPVSLNLSLGELCFLKLAGRVTNSSPLDDGSYTLGIKFSALKDWNIDILDSVIHELRQNHSASNRSFATIHVSEDKLALEAAQLAVESTESHAKAGAFAQRSRPHHADLGQRSRLTAKKIRNFTPDPSWVDEMNRYLEPHRRAIWGSKLVRETSTGELSLAQVRGWIIQFYPFIESFPQFMATYLAKAPDSLSRAFLIDNLRVEKRHAEQWVTMAEGFGVAKDELLNTPIIPEVESLTHWMWSITNRGSFVEAVSAVNFAVEGVTQGIASIAVRGFKKYHGSDGVHLPHKAYYWMEEHATYDDLHPYEALEVIKQLALSEEAQQKVVRAAQRSLEYLFRALEACYWAYAPQAALLQK